MLATAVVRYIAAVGTGYPPRLVLNLEPEGPQLQESLEMCGNSHSVFVLQQGSSRLDQEGKRCARSTSLSV